MATVEYKGKTFEVDEDGFLQKFEDWTLEWVDYVKDSEGIKELSDEHNKVIEFLQDYYKKNGIAPMFRVMVEARAGHFQPGDDLLFIIAAGDIREHVLASLTYTLTRVKSEAITKREVAP